MFIYHFVRLAGSYQKYR